jgi:hypothetical protein
VLEQVPSAVDGWRGYSRRLSAALWRWMICCLPLSLQPRDDVRGDAPITLRPLRSYDLRTARGGSRVALRELLPGAIFQILSENRESTKSLGGK